MKDLEYKEQWIICRELYKLRMTSVSIFTAAYINTL